MNIMIIHIVDNETMWSGKGLFNWKGRDKMIYACEEHIDIALDTIVDDYETFPNLMKIEGEEELSTSCEFCQNKAIYIVANK